MCICAYRESDMSASSKRRTLFPLDIHVLGASEVIADHHPPASASATVANLPFIWDGDAFSEAVGDRRGCLSSTSEKEPASPTVSKRALRQLRSTEEMKLMISGNPYRHFGERGPLGGPGWPMVWDWQRPWCSQDPSDIVSRYMVSSAGATATATFEAAPIEGKPCPFCQQLNEWSGNYWLTHPTVQRDRNRMAVALESIIAANDGVLEVAVAAEQLALPRNAADGLTLPAAIIRRALSGRPGGIIVRSLADAELLAAHE